MYTFRCHVVSRRYRVPETVRGMGEAAVREYLRMRSALVDSHNKDVEQAVEEESEVIRDLTKGHPVIVCQECDQDVYWGNIRVHRRGGQGGCVNSILNFSDSE